MPETLSTDDRLRELAERWSKASAAERANAQMYLIELADALGVERPKPAGSGYEFEYPIKVVNRDGTETTNFADLYKAGHFLLEAKDEGEDRSNDVLLRKAFGQAVSYAVYVPGGPPPYLMVLDVGKTLLIWDRWNGSYGGFNAARRVNLRELANHPDDVELLRDIWERPEARDPRARAARVTKEIATRLAELAASLERRGHDQEQVARFLIRCVFTMFAEDEDLLPGEPFRHALQDVGLEEPEELPPALEQLWAAMDEGRYFGPRQLLRFNGHFFKDHSALPLERSDIAVLLEAAAADWRDVEPTIFGTLLTRALDPKERHRLGAEYTPRAYVERLVRPTVEEPIRERWTLVQAEVLQLREKGGRRNERAAERRLREFHAWLRSLRFLDPACGSGNFLYVALAVVKRIEYEVLRALEEVTGQLESMVEEVDPSQFYGIEIKPWAREIAELTLWIGYHQFWREHHGGRRPKEPLLEDTGTLELRDAVLAWDEIQEDPERSRPDPTPRIPHPVTGELVPDPDATLAYEEHTNPHPAPWPEADFIIGNPPYMGNKRMREAFGDGYVDALRAAYPEVPESADYVMYWWYRVAQEVAAGRTIRAGLITTNSITQTFNRALVAKAMEDGVGIAWAVPTHPWVDDRDGAAVRVAMTVLERDPDRGIRVEVDENGTVVRQVEAEKLHSDLSAHADVASAAETPLRANEGLSSRGFTLVGRGFVLQPEEAKRLLASDRRYVEVVRPYRNGRDLTQYPRGVYVIDFGVRDEDEAREYPVLYDIVRDRVKPQRDANKRKSYREYWWRFGEPRVTLREALEGLDRFIATPYVSKHRFFTFLDSAIAPDEKVVCIASADPFVLGVLSSRIHVSWALGSGARLEDRPTYNNSLCFDSFPFPDWDDDLRKQIGDLAAKLDAHRWDALKRDKAVTMTAIYNVIEKLRSGDPLSKKERKVHESAACGVLLELHDELDRLVARAYGWEWPLEEEAVLDRLVALHDERVREEEAGSVRWLRPEYQIPRYGKESDVETELSLPGITAKPVQEKVIAWPSDVLDQIAALRNVIADRAASVEEAAAAFKGARRDIVNRHLETLEMLGEVRRTPDGRFHPVPAAAELVAS